MEHKKQWINLNNERPEIAEWVLCLCTRGSYWLAFRANGGWYINTGNGQIFVWNKEPDKAIEVEYWFPIPKLPIELQNRLFQKPPDNLVMCTHCYRKHSNKDYEGYCSQSCFDGI